MQSRIIDLIQLGDYYMDISSEKDISIITIAEVDAKNGIVVVLDCYDSESAPIEYSIEDFNKHCKKQDHVLFKCPYCLQDDKIISPDYYEDFYYIECRCGESFMSHNKCSICDVPMGILKNDVLEVCETCKNDPELKDLVIFWNRKLFERLSSKG